MRTMIRMRGADTAIANLSRWAKRAGETELPLEMISQYLEGREKELFATKGASAGRPWPEDEPTTVATKERHGGSPDVMRDTDALYNSLTSSEDENAIRDIGPGFLVFGTRLGYADVNRRTHRSRGGQRMVPARRVIDFTAKDRYAILKIMSGWLNGRMDAGVNFRKFVRPSIRIIR